jgi:hypothetical protein
VVGHREVSELTAALFSGCLLHSNLCIAFAGAPGLTDCLRHFFVEPPAKDELEHATAHKFPSLSR